MKAFIMENKIIKILSPLVFWLTVWIIVSRSIGNAFLFPSVSDTLNSLIVLFSQSFFYKSIIFSSIRVILGLLMGGLFGIVLALICNKISLLNFILSPMITIIRSTPVASFIVVLWVLMSGDALSVFIGFLMVMPIIWQSTINGLSAIDESLLEVTKVFRFSKLKKFKLLTVPTLKKYLVPAFISSVGLAWKAEIAAEIIAYTKNSIGQGINDAKYNMDTSTVFAWTLVVIIFSILLEAITKVLLRRHKNGSQN